MEEDDIELIREVHEEPKGFKEFIFTLKDFQELGELFKKSGDRGFS